MFVDEVQVRLRGGKGGDGCVSFHREKFVQRGGPDGGQGGDGGSVVLLPTTHKNTLFHLKGKRLLAAQNGQPGMSKNCSGRGAPDLVVEVPVGTQVLDAEMGNLLADLAIPGEPFVAARGGRGGRGNSSFATATHRSPKEYERGKDGEDRLVRLSLKLIADVGLVGLPNAGKSTLLSKLTRARPKIAGYPFTTLEPMLGIVEGPSERTFVMADIPGLIEGAHLGKGLGDRFLRHVERTRLLLHLIDCSALAETEPARAHEVICAELLGHAGGLARRRRLVVATKIEDEAAEQRAEDLEQAIGEEVLRISAATGKGLNELVLAVLRELSPG
ncbi:MAG: GTPase ObgE [Planctomycetota bacterium]